MSVFKNVGKAIGYFFLLPLLLVCIVLYALFGLCVFVFQFFKMIVLFFTGRNLSSDLLEDIQVKAMITVDPDKDKEENDESLSLYPGNGATYGVYSSPEFEEEKSESETEVEYEDEEEPLNDVGGDD